MATIKQIQFKRSNVAGSKPKPVDLAEGELALNIKDRTIFTKDADGAIVDLGFAKGGNVDGNIIHKGDYNQTGNYDVAGKITQTAGDFSTTGNIKADGNIRSYGEIVASTSIISLNGSMRSRGPGNVHLWLEGTSVDELAANPNGPGYVERGVLYSEPTAAKGGSVRLRVQNGHATGHTNTLYIFGGDGTFDAPIITTNLVDHYKKPYNQYDSSSLVGYSGSENRNLLRRFRGLNTGVIFHEAIDYSTNAPDGTAALSYFTGLTPTDKVFSIAAGGHAQINKSLMIGGVQTGQYSGLPGNYGYSLALGDGDSGLGWIRDGTVGVIGNSQLVAHWNPGSLYSDKQFTAMHTSGVSENAIMPPEQMAMIRVMSSVDGNNAAGPGDTHIGYSAGGKIHHYFRGKGLMNIDTQEGIQIRNTATFLGDLNATGRTLTLGTMYLNSATYPNGETRINNWHAAGANSFRFEIFSNISKSPATRIRRNILTSDFDDVNNPAGTALTTTLAGSVRVDNTLTANTGLLSGGAVTWLKAGGASRDIGINLWGTNDRQSVLEFRDGDPAGYMMYLHRLAANSRVELNVNGNIVAAENIRSSSATINGATTTNGLTSNGRITAKGAGSILQMLSPNQPGAAGSTVHLLGTRGTTNAFYLGCPADSHSEVNLHNYVYNTAMILRENDVYFNKSITCSGVVQAGGDMRSIGTLYLGPNTGNVAGQPRLAPGDGNLYGKRWASFGGADDYGGRWAADALSWVNGRVDTKYNTSGGTITGNVHINGTLNTGENITTSKWMNAAEFNLTSDIFYKKDITDIESQSAKLHDVKIRRYKMKDGTNDNAIGVIAQEFEKSYPELVTINSDGKKAVNYRAMSTVLWKIVQEKDVELQDMKSRLDRIEELLSK